MRDAVLARHGPRLVPVKTPPPSEEGRHPFRMQDGEFFRFGEAVGAFIVLDMNEHIELINRYYGAFNERRFDDYDALFAPDATLEGPGGVTGTGADAMKALV